MTIPGSTDDEVLPLADRLRDDAVCDRFEAAWREGERPEIAAYLDGVDGPARERLFGELLAVELEFRNEQGEAPTAAGYRARYPEFPRVLDSAFPRDDAEAETRTLSADADATRSMGATPRVGDGDPTEDALRAAGYEVDRELGRGGMGVVYRAYQVALRRTVALKVIRSAGFASEDARRRFQNEAEAVAQLDHPHIVPIFEVGESRGLQYFSMKLIAGAGLDRRLEGYGRDPRAAARLVAIAARAIHHAHERGILHRDLKPANILVDERGDPHVTDFGLARRIEPGVGGDLTHSGAIVGTPSYMSPEQATGVKGSLTTATDVYGLGAVLYAVLTGRAPHTGSSFVEVLDRVRETRPEPPSKCNRRVPRDLEVICLTALEKDPKRRYPSALALAEDLDRWLAGRPIAARPVGPARRAWMWCRRHPLPAALAALLVLAIAAGFSGVTWKWREAEEERSNYAAIDDFLGRMIAEASTEVNPRDEHFTVVAMLDRAAARIGGDFQGRPNVEAAIRERVGRAYLSRGAYAEAEFQLRSAIKLDGALYGPEDPRTLGVANVLAAALAESGKPAEAEPLLRRNLDACRRAAGPEAGMTLDATRQLGVLLRRRGKLAESEALLRRTLDARRRVLRTDHPDTLQSVMDLCLLCLDRAQFAEAEALAFEYEHGIRCAHGPKHPDNVTALANRGRIRLLQGKLAEAEPFYRQAAEEARRILGAQHLRTLAADGDYSRVHDDLERSRDAQRAAP